MKVSSSVKFQRHTCCLWSWSERRLVVVITCIAGPSVQKFSESGVTYFRSPDIAIRRLESKSYPRHIKCSIMQVSELLYTQGFFTLARPWLPGPASIASPDATLEDRNFVTSQGQRCSSSYNTRLVRYY